MQEYNGILPLYKPRGMTSHDCVFRLRKLLKFRKIGHTGTLDPDVDGVLVLCLGRATRVARFLLDYGKTYEGILTLGTATTTEDRSGEVTESCDVETAVARSRVESVFASMHGTIEQRAPLYSAVKVNGRKLYEYARAGLSVERPVRQVKIYHLELLDEAQSYQREIPFKVSCSKGTYVRTLAVDIGRRLGYPAHLHRLTRLKAGPFRLSDCLTFEQIETQVSEKRFQSCLKPLEVALGHLRSWTVDDQEAEKISHGAVLPIPAQFDDQPHAVYNNNGICLAIYQIHPENPGLIKPLKVLL
ncbi:MAG: tRNA pseudouridine(55) synthase TruB [Sporolactobacillus sp.]